MTRKQAEKQYEKDLKKLNCCCRKMAVAVREGDIRKFSEHFYELIKGYLCGLSYGRKIDYCPFCGKELKCN